MHSLPLSLDMTLFLLHLWVLRNSSHEKWTPYLCKPYGEKKGLIRLKLQGSGIVFSPLSAVYYHLTGQEVVNSFLMPEMTPFFKGENGNEERWWEIIDISYASDACDVSRQYNRELRNCLLHTLGLPVEKR